ncbi:MAG: nucleotide exchange factor GrpE [Omnitrophica WOR_2 bacterium RIFCSPHIGHO2_01_FULL_48_9]|nr:MAG: nucleotide exchange factor GrpE [Omnitrophica WOR_2 bacterium RIFCSPHIGHO2_02_FULL_48_11]OGX29862.1 MAG: nucleotide exchange factor GrpE [Omnitrophica WOR_2 bacterium RIFCSPHIGHO2_01_FULL_48_9]
MSHKDQEKKVNTTEAQVKPDTAEKLQPDPGLAASEMLEISKADYENLVAEAAEYKDKYVRLFAEFENARKRTEREKLEFIKYANEGLLVQFLNILDDLERSVEAAKAQHQDYAAFLKGIELVMAHVYEMLKKNDVKPMESLGKKFDPHCHEPLMQVESNEHEDGAVVEEFQKGYYLGDRVVRVAKVKVAKQKT